VGCLSARRNVRTTWTPDGSGVVVTDAVVWSSSGRTTPRSVRPSSRTVRTTSSPTAQTIPQPTPSAWTATAGEGPLGPNGDPGSNARPTVGSAAVAATSATCVVSRSPETPRHAVPATTATPPTPTTGSNVVTGTSATTATAATPTTVRLPAAVARRPPYCCQPTTVTTDSRPATLPTNPEAPSELPTVSGDTARYQRIDETDNGTGSTPSPTSNAVQKNWRRPSRRATANAGTDANRNPIALSSAWPRVAWTAWVVHSVGVCGSACERTSDACTSAGTSWWMTSNPAANRHSVATSAVIAPSRRSRSADGTATRVASVTVPLTLPTSVRHHPFPGDTAAGDDQDGDPGDDRQRDGDVAPWGRTADGEPGDGVQR